MYNDINEFDKYERKMEKQVEKFATKTIKKAEDKSRIFSTTVDQIANVSDVGENINKNINDLDGKIREISPSNIDFSKARK